MTTARDIINLAMKEAGVLGVGQTLLAEDTNDGFTLLQRMVNLWQQKRWLVPSLTEVVNIGNNQRSNPIGPGQFYNCPRPVDIKAGYIVQLNTGSTAVSLPLFKIYSYENYIQIAIKNLNTLPDHFFYDAKNPIGNVFVWPIPNDQYEIHLLVQSLLGFDTSISSGEITNEGDLYTNGNYVAIPLTGGNGSEATANLAVVGNKITTVNIANPGQGYLVNDKLSVDPASIGGTGSGFEYTVDDTTGNLDSEIIMPPEYEEALHYNLAIRLCAMYQIQASADTKALAKAALNTIRTANTQVPTLGMPITLKRGKAFNIYNADGY